MDATAYLLAGFPEAERAVAERAAKGDYDMLFIGTVVLTEYRDRVRFGQASGHCPIS